MLKHLPIFILFLLVFTTAHAQTNADSIVVHAVVDTAKKQPIDTVVKHQPTDTIAKHPVVDSTVTHLHTDSVAKHPLVDSVVKHSPAKLTIKHPANTIVVKHSTVKSLSDMRYNAYLNGEDLDSLALSGQLNHYPLPDEALKYKVQLGLNPGQVAKLKDMAATLHRKKIEMGSNIIRNEKMLDSLFHNKQMTDGILIFYTNRSGLYFGELKGAILMACYNTEKILSDDQIRKLEALEKANNGVNGAK